MSAPFRALGDVLREHAQARPDHPALVQGAECLTWGALDFLMDRVASALQRDGVRPGDAIVLAGEMTPTLAALFLGALRAGVVVAPLAHGVTRETFAAMLTDAAPRRVFVDSHSGPLLPASLHARAVALDTHAPVGAVDTHAPRMALDSHASGVAADSHAPRVTVDTHGPARMAADSHAAGMVDSHAAGMVDSHAAGMAKDSHVARTSQDSHVPRVAMDSPPARGARAGYPAGVPLADWLAPAGQRPEPVRLRPEDPFNIIYSSGTTGTPKGVVQPHGMRWMHVQRGVTYGYGPDTVALLSTPLYSNTTLVVFFPTLGFGGTVHLQPKFDAGEWLDIAEAQRVTHTMLVPVQYRRLLAHPDFGRRELSAMRMKFCTSAPFDAVLKAETLRRFPGGLVELYGMTEGGGTCILEAHRHPDKLHTVGRPAAGHDIRLIDDAGREVAPGEAGEVVGRSPGMMTGYHNQPEKSREAEWWSPAGERFIRTGDIGRFDEDGFLSLFDRKKDMIISGGFNIYPSDLEAKLREHPAVQEAAVVGVASPEWGETPVAFVERRAAGEPVAEEDLRLWLNARVGKTQRLSALRFVPELPRNAIGKVLKRELRDRWTSGA